VALTGLALLAYLGADHSPTKSGAYQQTVERALRFILLDQKNDGDLRGENGGNLYDQAIATLALAEAATLSRDPKYIDAATKGANFLLSAQNGRSGGWRYFPGESADTSVTGWCAMALHAVEQSGTPMPAQVKFDLLRWLDATASGTNRILGAYQIGSAPSESMTAQAVFTRVLLEQRPTPDQILEASAYVTRQPPQQGAKDFYRWYYTSMMLMQTQSKAWPTWNAEMRAHLLKLQRRDGAAAGSWDSDGLRDDPGGRVFSTTMGTLTLEVYYRYLPQGDRKDE